MLALGPVPTVGEDQKFPGGFVISAEKAPNRRGVEEILAHFTRCVDTLDDLPGWIGGASSAACGSPAATRHRGSTRPAARAFEKLPLLIVQDLFPSPLSERATYELPGRGLCRARRLLHEPQRPAANVDWPCVRPGA